MTTHCKTGSDGESLKRFKNAERNSIDPNPNLQRLRKRRLGIERLEDRLVHAAIAALLGKTDSLLSSNASADTSVGPGNFQVGELLTASAVESPTIDAGPSSNTIVLRRVATMGDYEVLIDGIIRYRYPSTLASLTINGNGGNDTFTVDYDFTPSIKNIPIPPDGVYFNGGGDPEDVVSVSGGIYYVINQHMNSASSGDISLQQLFCPIFCGTIPSSVTRHVNYSGVSAVVIAAKPMIASFFTLPDGQNSGVTVGDDIQAATDFSQLRGPTISDTYFLNPPELIVQLGNNGNSISLLKMDPAFTGRTTVNGGAGADTITGNALANTLNGNNGNDILNGGGGNDVLNGGPGNDSYLFDTDVALGTDTLNESGGGIDTLNFKTTSKKSVAVNLSTAGSQIVNANLSLILGSSASFENVIGGTMGDTLIGNTLDNKFTGGGGNDFLQGGAGDDTYLFDTDLILGTDTLNEAGGGFDTLDFSLTTLRPVAINLGNAALQVVNVGLSLVLKSAVAFEKVIGGSLGDSITGNSLNNILIGGPGNDILRGGSGRDLLIGGTGADTLAGENSDDLMISGTTSYDNNASGLRIILKEWSDLTKSYATRVTNLRTGVASIRLQATGIGATVFKDNSVDQLTGGIGKDWYFASLSDVINNLEAGELVDGLP